MSHAWVSQRAAHPQESPRRQRRAQEDHRTRAGAGNAGQRLNGLGMGHRVRETILTMLM